MSKRKDPPGDIFIERVEGSAGGFCLLNTMLMLAAPSALVALVVKVVRR